MLGSWIPKKRSASSILLRYWISCRSCRMNGEETEVPLNRRGSLSMPAFGNTLHLFGSRSTASVDILILHQEVLRMVGREAVEAVSPLPTHVFPCSLHFWYTSNSQTRVDCIWNVMAHAQKPDFVFRRNGRVHLNRQGRQFSRLLAA
jgi:hypothetical protein